MFEHRNLKLDLVALVLVALVIFLALALLTYSPSDPVPELVSPLDRLYQSDTLVHPPSTGTVNLCGRWGALTADLLLTGLGLGSYYLVVSLAILDVLLLWRRPINAPMVRLGGWFMSLVGLTAVVATIAPWLSPGPVIGSGGYLGALGSGILQTHFASIGGLVMGGSLILGGLLLCTDYALLRIGYFVLVLSLAITFRLGRQLVARASWTDEADEQAGAADEEVSIRIRGRRLDECDEEEEEEYDEDAQLEDEEEDKEYEEDEAIEETVSTGTQLMTKKPSSSFRTRVASALGLKQSVEASREEVMDQLEAASLNEGAENYELPPIDLLSRSEDVCFDEHEKEVRRKAGLLEKTFGNFGFQVKVVEVETGPVIAQYEVELEAGLRLSRIAGLADDLAIALRVPSVRIVAPIPGKNTVGIEVPNKNRQLVHLREVMEEANGKSKRKRIPLFLGKDVAGNPLVVDLATLPHLLIAGRTGTGKSVCLNSIIASILMTRRPDEVRLLMVDPKMVELSCYKTLPHLMHPVVTDMRKAEAILAWAVEKMEERYELLARAGVRNVSVYNQLSKEELLDRIEPESEEERNAIPLHLPYIVFVADELADLMLTSGKEVEQHIIRLAQKSRAVGIHLILATQKPTVDVITGLIKSNLPARIAFQVASRTDSRVVLDEMGAERLLGHGDMLFLWPGTSTLLRGQGTLLSDEEIDSIVDFVSTGEQQFVKELVHMKVEEPTDDRLSQLKNRDDLYTAAVEIVISEGRGSVSLLQRALGIGYGRAARLIDFMAEDGIVGEYAGSQAREVLISAADWEQSQNQTTEPASESSRRKKNNIVALHSTSSGESAPSDFESASDDTFEDEEELQADDYEDYEQAHDEDEVEAEDELEKPEDELEEAEDEYEDDEYAAESA